MAAAGVLLLAFVMVLLKKRRIEAEKRRERVRLNRLYRFYRLQSIRRFKFLFVLLRASTRRKRRSAWSRQRSKHWWFEVVCRHFTNKDWMDNFRMSRPTFQYICQKLEPQLKKQDTVMRSAILVEMRVGMTLWKLATNSEFRTVGQLFGIARSTCHNIFHETVAAIGSILGEEFLRIPTEQQFRTIISGFETKFGFPQVVGAIDGTHIPIIAPEDYPADYHNRKGFHSVVLQAIVDHNYKFWNINFGFPGRCHDARVFTNSPVFELGSEQELFPASLTRDIDGVNIPPLLIGDAAYPLLSWLMKPYIDHGQLSQQQQNFNYSLSRARMVVENAFGRLKGRWRCLLKRNDALVHEIPSITKACCVLHNVCETFREDFQQDWFDHTNDSTCNHCDGVNINNGQQLDANHIRNKIVEFL